VPLGLANRQGAASIGHLSWRSDLRRFCSYRRAGRSLPEAGKAYQSNRSSMPNGRGSAPPTERTPTLAGYRPQIVASLSAGLQAVRNLLPDNTVQSATLSLDHRVTVRRHCSTFQTPTACAWRNCRCSRAAKPCECRSGRAARRRHAYSNVLANQSLVEAQRSNVAFLRETLGAPKSASMPAT